MNNRNRKLPPINGGSHLTLTKFDDDQYRNDRLLHFSLPEIKKRRHYTFLKQKASTVSNSLRYQLISIDID